MLPSDGLINKVAAVNLGETCFPEVVGAGARLKESKGRVGRVVMSGDNIQKDEGNREPRDRQGQGNKFFLRHGRGLSFLHQ